MSISGATSASYIVTSQLCPLLNPNLIVPQINAETLAIREEVMVDSAWYQKSGATSHITNVSSSMAYSTPYNGSGKSLMANVNSLPISVVGSSPYNLLLRDSQLKPTTEELLMVVYEFC